MEIMNGINGCSTMPMFHYPGKFDRQAAFTGRYRIAKVPGEELD